MLRLNLLGDMIIRGLEHECLSTFLLLRTSLGHSSRSVILYIGSLAAGGEGVKDVVAAAKTGQKGKSLWEAFKVLQGPVREGVGWLDETLRRS